MNKELVQIRTLSIVFIGDFNPIIVQPFWLAEKGLIKEQEAEGVKVEIMHNELVRYELSWASLEITKKRFEIRTNQEPFFDIAKDLIVSIFNILSETPIEAVGINNIFHISLIDAKRYYEFGNKLAPLSNWNTILIDPKVLHIEITEETRRDELPGYVRIIVNPSNLKINFGISININDHYSTTSGSSGRKGEMVGCLKRNWENSQRRAWEIVEGLYDKVNS